jgi:hypothetical protein
MAIHVPKRNRTFIPAPAGTHAAVCVKVVDLGEVTTEFNGEQKTQPKIAWVFQIDKRAPSGKPFNVWIRFTFSSHKKGNLAGALKNWFGRAFTESEIDELDFASLVGKPALISVIHVNQRGKTFANISSIIPLPEGMKAPTLIVPQIDDAKPSDEASKPKASDPNQAASVAGDVETPKPSTFETVQRLIGDLIDDEDDPEQDQ